MDYKNPKIMNSEQFEFIADLIGAGGMSRKGCKLMLVENMRQCDAARKLNISPKLLSVSVKRYRDIYFDIIKIFTSFS